jgi:hypothetical protein
MIGVTVFVTDKGNSEPVQRLKFPGDSPGYPALLASFTLHFGEVQTRKKRDVF